MRERSWVGTSLDFLFTWPPAFMPVSPNGRWLSSPKRQPGANEGISGAEIKLCISDAWLPGGCVSISPDNDDNLESWINCIPRGHVNLAIAQAPIVVPSSHHTISPALPKSLIQISTVPLSSSQNEPSIFDPLTFLPNFTLQHRKRDLLSTFQQLCPLPWRKIVHPWHPLVRWPVTNAVREAFA